MIGTFRRLSDRRPSSAQPQTEIAQLDVVDGRRGAGQRVSAARGLREGDHFADVVAPGDDRNQAVDAKGDAAVRGCAVLQRVQQEAKALLGLLGVEADDVEDPLLHLSRVDTDRAAADLIAVEHEVI